MCNFIPNVDEEPISASGAVDLQILWRIISEVVTQVPAGRDSYFKAFSEGHHSQAPDGS